MADDVKASMDSNISGMTDMSNDDDLLASQELKKSQAAASGDEEKLAAVEEDKAAPAPEPEPEPEPEPDLTRPTGQARVKPSAEESHAQREARLAALAEKHQKDLESGNAFTVPRSPPKQPPSEEPAGPAEPPENLSTNLKWELSELEKHLTSERGVSAEALEGVWEQVGLLIRGTLRALAPKIRPQVRFNSILIRF